jgi:hypothetical protein
MAEQRADVKVDACDTHWAAFTELLFHAEARRYCGEQFGWVPMPAFWLSHHEPHGGVRLQVKDAIRPIPIARAVDEADNRVTLELWPHGAGPFDDKWYCERRHKLLHWTRSGKEDPTG